MFAHVNMYMYLSPFQNEYRFVTVYVHSAGCVDVALGGAGPPLGHLLGKWPPELTFRIDLYAVGAPVGHLLGNGLRSPLFL